jgi:hypothetical protein
VGLATVIGAFVLSWLFVERFFLRAFPPARIPLINDTFAFLQSSTWSEYDPPVRAD